MTETQRTIDFVLAQYRAATSWRNWRDRLAVSGYGLRKSRNAHLIIALPQGEVVCKLPFETRASSVALASGT